MMEKTSESAPCYPRDKKHIPRCHTDRINLGNVPNSRSSGSSPISPRGLSTPKKTIPGPPAPEELIATPNSLPRTLNGHSHRQKRTKQFVYTTRKHTKIGKNTTKINCQLTDCQKYKKLTKNTKIEPYNNINPKNFRTTTEALISRSDT